MRWRLGGAVAAAGVVLAGPVGASGTAVAAGGRPGEEVGLAGARVAGVDLAFQVINVNSGKCLTVAGGGGADNAIVVQRSCGKDLSSRWRFVPEVTVGSVSFLVVNVRSDKCLTVRADGTAVQRGCDGDRARRWHLQRRPGVPPTVTTTDALLENAETRRCLTIAGGGVAENAVAVQGDCDSERSRRWTVRLAGGPSLAGGAVTTSPA
jgi:cytolethal distending toxin subunit A